MPRPSTTHCTSCIWPSLCRPLRLNRVPLVVPRVALTRWPCRVGFVSRVAPLRATEEEILLTSEELELDAEDRMEQMLVALTQKHSSVRTGCADPAVFDRVMVDYYGTPTPLKSLAGITVSDAATMIIRPFGKSNMAEIEKAILTPDLGLTPNNDGKKIRISVPPLTDQRRRELTTVVVKIDDESKAAVHNIRRDVVKSSA